MKLLVSAFCLGTLAACDCTMVKLDHARATWEEAEIANYTYDLYEPGWIPSQPPTRITVQNGVVTAVAAIRPYPIVGQPQSVAPTIDALFDDIEDHLRRGGIDVRVTWDDTLGLPLAASFDIEGESHGFLVKEFQPTP